MTRPPGLPRSRAAGRALGCARRWRPQPTSWSGSPPPGLAPRRWPQSPRPGHARRRDLRCAPRLGLPRRHRRGWWPGCPSTRRLPCPQVPGSRPPSRSKLISQSVRLHRRRGPSRHQRPDGVRWICSASPRQRRESDRPPRPAVGSRPVSVSEPPWWARRRRARWPRLPDSQWHQTQPARPSARHHLHRRRLQCFRRPGGHPGSPDRPPRTRRSRVQTRNRRPSLRSRRSPTASNSRS